ncbi:MAG: hypothetical protein ACKO6I_02070 [Sphingomonadales bacterium]
MRYKLLIIILIMISTFNLLKGQVNSNKPIQSSICCDEHVYKLFPTKNIWTFLKLDTRNGKIWQVHFTVTSDGERGELDLNILPLVSKDKETNGRFTLYQTENTFNFLLIDQIDGAVYQVQWSQDQKNRIVLPVTIK